MCRDIGQRARVPPDGPAGAGIESRGIVLRPRDKHEAIHYEGHGFHRPCAELKRPPGGKTTHVRWSDGVKAAVMRAPVISPIRKPVLRLGRSVAQSREGRVQIGAGLPIGRRLPGRRGLSEKCKYVFEIGGGQVGCGHQRFIRVNDLFEIAFQEHVKLLLFVHDLDGESIFVLGHAAEQLAIGQADFDAFIIPPLRLIGVQDSLPQIDGSSSASRRRTQVGAQAASPAAEHMAAAAAGGSEK